MGPVAERARIRRRGLDYSCVLVRGAGKLLVSHPPYSGSTGRGVHLSVPLLCRVRSALQISALPFPLRRRCAPRTWRSRLPVLLSTRRNKRLPPIFGSSGKIVSAVRERCLSRRKRKRKTGEKKEKRIEGFSGSKTMRRSRSLAHFLERMSNGSFRAGSFFIYCRFTAFYLFVFFVLPTSIVCGSCSS